jgi:RNA polymerase sigma-70 factor (ECF subfamily)
MTDKEIIFQVQNGNTNAFRFLVDQHKNLVWHMVIRMVRLEHEAEDLSQEIFMRVFRDIKRFRGDSKLSTWIGSIAYNVCIDFIRKKGREQTDLHEDPALLASDNLSDESASKLIHKAEMKEIIHGIIEAMPLHYRTVITLFHLEEMSYKEIGDITGMPEGTIKSYLNRGRQMIQDKIIKLVPDIRTVMYEVN